MVVTCFITFLIRVNDESSTYSVCGEWLLRATVVLTKMNYYLIQILIKRKANQIYGINFDIPIESYTYIEYAVYKIIVREDVRVFAQYSCNLLQARGRRKARSTLSDILRVVSTDIFYPNPNS